MLQATATLMAEARVEEEGRLLAYLGDKGEPGNTLKRDYNRRVAYGFTARLRNRVCSDSCLKVIYLSCATLISASFIVECILLHLIIVPYLSESVFEAGACRYISSRSEIKKRCENKCSKERSYFPCLQIMVRFTPFRQLGNLSADDSAIWNTWSKYLADGLHTTSYDSVWDANRRQDVPKEIAQYLNTTAGSRTVYLYDYFSTFTAHKIGRCATSPCHRREEDNVLAVEGFKRELWSRKEFLCYARPSRLDSTSSSSTSSWLSSQLTEPSMEEQYVVNNDANNTLAFSLNSPGERGERDDDEGVEEVKEKVEEKSWVDSTKTEISVNELTVTQSSRKFRPILNLLSRFGGDQQDAAAILHRLYSSAMFWHSLCWPCGIFLGSLLLLLFTYLADGCEAWAGDKTVIA